VGTSEIHVTTYNHLHQEIKLETGKLGKSKNQWSHELQGYRNEGPNSANHLDSKTGLSFWIMSALQYAVKDQAVLTDIWELLEINDTHCYEDEP